MSPGTINTPKKPAVLLCPVCGCRLAPNKGWAAQFYDGYCNHCDMPVEDAKVSKEKENGCVYRFDCYAENQEKAKALALKELQKYRSEKYGI